MVASASTFFKNLFIAKYSSLPNRRATHIKRSGGKDEPFLISMVPGIINGGENFYASYSKEEQNELKFLIKKQKIKKVVPENKIMSLT